MVTIPAGYSRRVSLKQHFPAPPGGNLEAFSTCSKFTLGSAFFAQKTSKARYPEGILIRCPGHEYKRAVALFSFRVFDLLLLSLRQHLPLSWGNTFQQPLSTVLLFWSPSRTLDRAQGLEIKMTKDLSLFITAIWSRPSILMLHFPRSAA